VQDLHQSLLSARRNWLNHLASMETVQPRCNRSRCAQRPERHPTPVACGRAGQREPV